MKICVGSLQNEEHLPLTVKNCRVYLDGVLVPNGVAADDEGGWVDTYPHKTRNESDSLFQFIDYDNPEKGVKVERKYGKVEIKMEEE